MKPSKEIKNVRKLKPFFLYFKRLGTNAKNGLVANLATSLTLTMTEALSLTIKDETISGCKGWSHLATYKLSTCSNATQAVTTRDCLKLYRGSKVTLEG